MGEMKAALKDGKNEQRQFIGAEYFKQLVFSGIQELYAAQESNKFALLALQEIQQVFVMPEEDVHKVAPIKNEEQATCKNIGKIVTILSARNNTKCPMCNAELLETKTENGAPAWRHP